VKQYASLLGTEGVRLRFSDEAVQELAASPWRSRVAENIGARRLATVLETVLEDVSFRAPEAGSATSWSTPTRSVASSPARQGPRLEPFRPVMRRSRRLVAIAALAGAMACGKRGDPVPPVRVVPQPVTEFRLAQRGTQFEIGGLAPAPRRPARGSRAGPRAAARRGSGGLRAAGREERAQARSRRGLPRDAAAPRPRHAHPRRGERRRQGQGLEAHRRAHPDDMDSPRAASGLTGVADGRGVALHWTPAAAQPSPPPPPVFSVRRLNRGRRGGRSRWQRALPWPLAPPAAPPDTRPSPIPCHHRRPRQLLSRPRPLGVGPAFRLLQWVHRARRRPHPRQECARRGRDASADPSATPQPSGFWIYRRSRDAGYSGRSSPSWSRPTYMDASCSRARSGATASASPPR